MPCDIAALNIVNWNGNVSLTCSRVLRGGYWVGGSFPLFAPQWVQERLSSYDLVMECLSDYAGQYGGPPDKKKTVHLKIGTTYIGTCPWGNTRK